ncbi:chromosome partitioning protein ParA [Candidatus Parcubacteria bacterium]|nr:MAG: chromosome partitioning protein ParA [Candidatus Parcubacteria bacterium]
MGKVISVVNQKGGVGKTTTSVNLGAYLAHLGKHVLIVDIDPQANATSGIGIDHKELEHGVYEALIGHKSMREVLKRTVIDRFLVAPATSALAGAGVEMVSMDEREFVLQNLLDQLKDDFDYIIIDGPPSLGLLTINSLVAADEIIIPIQSEYYALEGLGQLLETISLVKDNLKPDLNIMGAVVTMFDKRNKLSALVLDELKNHFPNKVFNTVIPRSVRLAEAPSYGKTIMHYDANSRGGKAYEMLAQEIIGLENLDGTDTDVSEEAGLYFGD